MSNRREERRNRVCSESRADLLLLIHREALVTEPVHRILVENKVRALRSNKVSA